MAMPVGSMVKKFRSEFEAAIEAAAETAPGPIDEAPADTLTVATGVA
jgi:hypothetical protein